MDQAFADYFRCPEEFSNFPTNKEGWSETRPGFFRLGPQLICYARAPQVRRSERPTDTLGKAQESIDINRSCCELPFDLTELVTNLRHERYLSNQDSKLSMKSLVRLGYYAARPLLPVRVRRHFQKLWLTGWKNSGFPGWPVDLTVDLILRWAMECSLKAHQVARIPFIWFWPEGKNACAMMTHDVETAAGLSFCGTLMDIDDSFGIKSSFQLIPAARYQVSNASIDMFRQRDFEVNVHDLKHDGHLYSDKQRFAGHAKRINQHAIEFGSKGFRAGALYRNVDWYGEYEFAYDMSLPNTARLDPQAGGCCTVMPFFIGNILELPVTTIQDYSLFHILGTYSTEIWWNQISSILDANGLMSFIVHPDYLETDRARNTYSDLLAHLANLRSERALWIATPGEVDSWWRQRNRMKIVARNDTWTIEGPGADRACLAYASLEDQKLSFSIEDNVAHCCN